jgi:hypothetical protein
MRHLVLVPVLAILVSACGGASTPTSPEVPAAPVCQTNNTARVFFENRFRDVTLDIAWDGVKVATLGPAAQSPALTVAAGTPHTMRFLIANTPDLACQDSTPILASCSTMTYFCPGS